MQESTGLISVRKVIRENLKKILPDIFCGKFLKNTKKLLTV